MRRWHREHAGGPPEQVEQEAADGELREHQHDDERTVSVLGLDTVMVRGPGVMRHRPARSIPRRRAGVLRSGSTVEKIARIGTKAHLVDVHHANADRLVRTRLDAGRGLAGSDPVRTHVALADDPLAGVEPGGVVRTGQRAVLAADALVVEVPDDPRDRVLLVGIHRAGRQAGRVEAVVTRRRHVLEHRQAGTPPTIRPTSRQDSPSSSPLSAWQAVTHALHPEQRSRSTSKASCWPGAGILAGMSDE